MSTLYVTEPPTDGKVILHTAKGEIEIELWSKEAPKACRNFVALAMEGYYDGCVWHRVVPGFIVQTGDPTGTGEGGESFYGKPFANELHQRLRFNRRGLVAMANTGERNSNDSQFFITLDATPELQNKHTIFGRVAGATIYNALALADVELSATEPDRPVYPPKLFRAEVVHNPFPALVPRITPAEREAQKAAKKMAAERQSAMERQRKKPKKNTALLSFGDEEDVPVISTEKKPMSSHDLLDDKRLSKRTYAPPPAKTKSRDDQVEAVAQLPLAQPDANEAKAPYEAVPAPKETANVSSGRDLLASLVGQYKKEKSATNKRKDKDASTLAMLESFQKKIRSDDARVPTKDMHSRPSGGSAWDDEDDMREYGASDEDDVDWRSHTFDSGGMPLSGSHDKYSVQDYQVIDSRDTKSDVAASMGFGGENVVRQHQSRTRQERLKTEGRRGRDWV